MKPFFCFLLLSRFLVASAQDNKPFVPAGDANYFDFWKGTWYVLNNDNSIDSTSWFSVKRSIHPSCFTEEWHFAATGSPIAICSWDKTNSKWGLGKQ